MAQIEDFHNFIFEDHLSTKSFHSYSVPHSRTWLRVLRATSSGIQSRS